MSETEAPSASPIAHKVYLGQKYFPQLDGLRALCVLLVVSVHLYDSSQRWAWLAGARGVTIFFVLSGYLITTLALREESQRGRLCLPAFFLRRVCRLLPLYYLTLAVYCVLILGLGMAAHQSGPLRQALPYYLFYLQEVPFCRQLVLANQDLPFFHSWSLGVEEKFYFVWPMLAFVAWRGTRWLRLGGTIILAMVLALVPLGLMILGTDAKLVGRMLFNYYPILVGCLLAELLHDPRWFSAVRRSLGMGTTWLWTLMFLAIHFATPWVTEPFLSHTLQTIYPVAVAVLGACLLLHEGSLQNFLCWRPLVFIGRLSYGIYLIHMLGMVTAYALLPLPARSLGGSILAYVLTSLFSIAGAWILAVTVETQGIALGRRLSQWFQEREKVPRVVEVPVIDPPLLTPEGQTLASGGFTPPVRDSNRGLTPPARQYPLTHPDGIGSKPHRQASAID